VLSRGVTARSRRCPPCVGLVLSLALSACGEPAAPDAGRDGRVDAGLDAAAPRDAAAPGPVCDPRAPACDADHKCTVTRWRLDQPWPAPRCTPVPDEGGGLEAVCFAVDGIYDGCDADHACTNFGTGEGFCVPLCRSPGAPCDAERGCVTVDPASGFALCLPTCEVDEDCPGGGRLECVDRDGLRVCELI